MVAKVNEELSEAKEAIGSSDEQAIADEIGDLLFAVVNLVRKNRLEAEAVLAAAMEKFITRFHAMERELQQQSRKLGEVDLAAMGEIWNRVKTSNRSARSCWGAHAPSRAPFGASPNGGRFENALVHITLTTVFAARRSKQHARRVRSPESAVADDN